MHSRYYSVHESKDIGRLYYYTILISSAFLDGISMVSIMEIYTAIRLNNRNHTSFLLTFIEQLVDNNTYIISKLEKY